MNLNIQHQTTSNGVSERAVEIGLASVSTQLDEDEFIFQLTSTQKMKAEALCNYLGTSWGTTFNLAIKSVLSHANLSQIEVFNLDDYPEQLGTENIRVVLDTKTLLRLEEQGMIEFINECAIAGINLLYDRLIEAIYKSLPSNLSQ
jgi:hypothetical protein